MKTKSGFGLGLPETQAAVAFLPLAAGLKQVYALETLENVARRTCGYIGSQYWNQGRTQEIKERVLHVS